ncbi:(Fe-S)-binding protein [Hornefia porci]|uniref:(Fe-S)-binding protein n=1 Tax=Hornefia porci TaxID=2652292 RepID=A0A1Q9JJH9_9FIRM|nr:4Fe-4S binding protein [Hornefia porci]OLR56369.1 (Fe-S)-binding protein [Hornefia porci]
MKRTIIHIDENKCNGCGICAAACHEGAIGIVDGKAKLLRDDYCDGLGDCLPACPEGAITFVKREAAAYDAEAVAINKKNSSEAGSPGTGAAPASGSGAPIRLSNWPVQIRLAPSRAPYFDGADLLIAADCTAYAYSGFHTRFLRNRVTLIGCPKLDGTDYSWKLGEILRSNDIRSVTVLRMEVPCCGGLEVAVNKALQDSGKSVPLRVTTISIDGEILAEKDVPAV